MAVRSSRAGGDVVRSRCGRRQADRADHLRRHTSLAPKLLNGRLNRERQRPQSRRSESVRDCRLHSRAATLSESQHRNSEHGAQDTVSARAACCALMGDVPSQLSTGVRSQNSDIAATAKSARAPPLMPPRAATTAPVASGTRSMPHAPCSRGNDHGAHTRSLCGADVSCHAVNRSPAVIRGL